MDEFDDILGMGGGGGRGASAAGHRAAKKAGVGPGKKYLAAYKAGRARYALRKAAAAGAGVQSRAAARRMKAAQAAKRRSLRGRHKKEFAAKLAAARRRAASLSGKGQARLGRVVSVNQGVTQGAALGRLLSGR